MAHTVFVCHSSRDKVVADSVCAALEGQRIPCWIAPRDILPGKEYGDALVEAISECRLLVLVFSAEASDSPQVRRELERAVSKNKIIVTFRIEDVVPTGAIEYAISNSHWLDAFTPPLEKHLAVLSQTISRLAKQDHTPPQQAVRGLGISPKLLLELPHNAGLALLWRCCCRANSLLLGNWLHGNSMWDTIGFMNKSFLPGTCDLIADPMRSDYEQFFRASLSHLNGGLTVATRNLKKLRAPTVIFPCMKIFIATAEFALQGSLESAEQGFFGTRDVFALINPNNSITERDMRLDYQKLADAAHLEKWSADTPIPEEFWDDLWRAGEPSWFNETLYQKTSWLDSVFGK